MGRVRAGSSYSRKELPGAPPAPPPEPPPLRGFSCCRSEPQSGHLWLRSSFPAPQPMQVTGTAVCTVPEGQTDPGKPPGSSRVKQGAALSSWKSSQPRARRSGKQQPVAGRPSKPEPAPFSQGPPAAAHEATQPSLSALQHSRRPPAWAY